MSQRNYRKRIIIILSLIILSLSAYVFINSIKDCLERKSIMVTVALYRGPSELHILQSEIYIFQLKSDGALEVFYGDRFADDFIDPKNINLVKNERKVLSEDQLVQINQKINQIKNSEFEENLVRHGWNAIIKCSGKSYRFAYGRANDKNHDELVTMLIEISPFEIVNSAGHVVEQVIID